jgi:ubiquinol-cytochrome c reductase cytochrome c1 subunit
MDGPNDEGEMFERPGKLSDPLPRPYANEEAGRAANGGALPPDLSLMAKARHGGIDYIVALLTGYCDAPAGKVLLPGLYYNPYFSGGAIAMPPPLMDGSVTYPDGTPATMTQMAKDVAIFLNWCAEPEHDERKLQGFKYLTVLSMILVVTGYYKRFRWSTLKTRKISYVN